MVGVVFPHNVVDGKAEDGRILHLAADAEGVGGIGFFLGLFFLFFNVYPADRAEHHQQEKGSQHAERVGDCIGGSELGRSGCGSLDSASGRDCGVGNSLLGSTESGSVGHGTGHNTGHNRQVFTGDEMDAECSQRCEQHERNGQYIHRQAVLAE